MSATDPSHQAALPVSSTTEQPLAAPASQASSDQATSAAKATANTPTKKAAAKKTAAAVRKPALNVTPKTPAKPVAKPNAEKLPKAKKPKLVRDSFTIPKTEYLVLEELKDRALKLAHPVKKTELIRAGIKALAAMADTGFLLALKTVPVIKTGRPTKD